MSTGIQPEISALIERGEITYDETTKLRCNSWEWEAMVPALTDEALVEWVRYALKNRETTQRRPYSTYNEALEGLYLPELLERFRGALGVIEDEGGMSPTQWLKQEKRIAEIRKKRECPW